MYEDIDGETYIISFGDGIPYQCGGENLSVLYIILIFIYFCFWFYVANLRCILYNKKNARYENDCSNRSDTFQNYKREENPPLRNSADKKDKHTRGRGKYKVFYA